jgi:hypothetical protein
MGGAAKTIPTIIALAVLVLTVMAVYAPVGGYGFLEFDDPEYVRDNPRVRGGLSTEGLGWAMTTFHAANWHPLTWLSLMTDVSLFGVDAGWMHRINVLLHALAVLVLTPCSPFTRPTSSRWPGSPSARTSCRGFSSCSCSEHG